MPLYYIAFISSDDGGALFKFPTRQAESMEDYIIDVLLNPWDGPEHDFTRTYTMEKFADLVVHRHEPFWLTWGNRTGIQYCEETASAVVSVCKKDTPAYVPISDIVAMLMSDESNDDFGSWIAEEELLLEPCPRRWSGGVKKQKTEAAAATAADA